MYWTPRILSILLICFLTLFSLDVFEPGLSAGEIALALLMHNIPSIIMIIILVVAWRIEIVGAIGFIGAGLLYIGLVFNNVIHSELPWYIGITWSLSLSGPAFIIGIMFLVNWIKKRKPSNSF